MNDTSSSTDEDRGTAASLRDLSRPGPIAIIGMGCRFPGGANSPGAFWRMIADGVDAISEVPPDRWNADRFCDPEGKPGTAVTRWGGFIDRPVDHFDARFFGISPREASHLDPMQRWLLEVGWEALDDAGLVPAKLAGSATGVFVGVFTEDVKIHQLREANRERIGVHTVTGIAMTMASNRLSYFFDFRGPSISLDTACSSSLVALHLACQSLESGESTLALAGGANAMFSPEHTIAESRAGMLSPEGRCKTFDAGADGYVRGEGAGLVVLKRLSEAERDGDRIHAVILGTGVNQDGATPGITVPSGKAQEALIRETCARVGIEPRQIRYMEAHGTGTPVGDPIEARALANVLGEGRPADDKCIVGSVKTNIGHLEAAAGIAGLIKAVLCLKHRQIPPHLHLGTPNPEIPFDQMAIRVPRVLESWPAAEGPALAAVNSFGFGGTNAYTVLTAAPVPAQPQEPVIDERAQLVPISARCSAALDELMVRYRDSAATSPAPLADLAAAAALGRSHHPHRLAVVASSREELRAALDASIHGEEPDGVARGESGARRLVFTFSGMGPQWWAMGRELLDEEPLFRAAVERCDRLLAGHADWSLLAELSAGEESSRMAETWLSQPASFALQVGLVELLRDWGIEADAIVGHSTGEAAAMWAAGVLSLEAAIEVIYHRSRLQQTTSGLGKLVALGLPLAEAERAIAGRDGVSIAAVNSPGAVTLAGDEAALAEIVRPFEERGVFVRFLRVEVPFHSHFMDRIEGELRAVLAGLEPDPAAIPLYSTVTAAAVAGPELDGSYWFRNVREPVRFASTVERLLADGYDTFLEIGPHPVLAGPILECLERPPTPTGGGPPPAGKTFAVLPTLRRGEPERASLLASLGRLYALGLPVRWDRLTTARRHVELPAYPWQHESSWDESAAAAGDRMGAAVHPLLGRQFADAHPSWQVELDGRSPACLRDHRIQGVTVFPGAGYVEMGIAGLRAALGDSERVLELADVRFEKALFLPPGQLTKVRLKVDPEELSFDVLSTRSGEGWTRHAAGGVLRTRQAGTRPAVDLEVVRGRCRKRVDLVEGYARLRAMGFEYGPLFQGLKELRTGDREALARVEVPAPLVGELGEYQIHPALLDACFQALILLAAGDDPRRSTYVPVAIDRMTVYGQARGPLRAHVRWTRWNDLLLQGDLTLVDAENRAVAMIEGFRARSIEGAQGAGATRVDNLLYDVAWQPYEMPAAEPVDAGTWMVFADHGGLGDELAARIEARGRRVFRVRAGDDFAADDLGAVVRPGQPEDFDRLLARLGSAMPLTAMVHLWSLDAPAGEEVAASALLAAQDAGPIAVLHLIQALGRRSWPDVPRLILVTRGAQLLPDDTAPAAFAQSPLWGLGRTAFHQEHPELRGRLIDLDPAAPEGEAENLLDLLEREGEEDQIAVRGGAGFVPRFVPGPERETGALIPASAPRFRADGAFLITGGLGGLGLTFARWLVERGARRLILMGRTPLPPRESWGEVERESSAAARIQAVRDLEALGASVHAAAVDVTDGTALEAFLARYRGEGWPPIRGVVHAAGVARPQLLLEMDAEDFCWALSPKLIGGWHLHRLLEDEPLEFFVLISSINAFGVSMGMGSYAAANAALDGFANYRRASALPAMSINWGAWAEVGMASADEVARDFAGRGLLPLAPEQGLRVMERLFELDRPQLVASHTDWPLLAAKSYPMGHPPPIVSQMVAWAARERDDGARQIGAAAAGDAAAGDAAASADPEERRQVLVHHVSETLGLGAEKIEAHQPLTHVGLDSMLAVELKNRLRNALGVEVSVVKLLQGLSVDQLAADLLAGPAVPETLPILPGTDPRDGDFPLSYGQQAMWHEYQLDRESWAYNVLSAVRILAPIDADALRDAFQELTDRHAVLRTTYRVTDGEAVQRVHRLQEAAFETVDISALPPERVNARVLAEARRPFDLERGPVVRMVLFTRSPREHVLLLVGHHVALDLGSAAILYRELDAVYPAKVAGDASASLPALDLDYTDYARWQQEMLAGPEGQRLEAFWRRQLAGELPVLELPFDRPRSKVPTRRGAGEPFALDGWLTSRFRALAEDRGTTLFTVLLTAFQVLLARLTGQDDVLVSSPMVGRSRGELAGLVGHFVHMVPLRGDLSGDPRFSELLTHMRRTVLEVLEHQEYPASHLVRLAREEREGRRTSLFDVGLALNAVAADRRSESYAMARPGARWHLAGLPAETLDLPQQLGQFDLGLELFETGLRQAGESLLGVLQYKPDLFDRTTVLRLLGHFRVLLRGMEKAPDQRISTLPLLTPAERHQLVVELPASRIRLVGGGVVSGSAYVLDRKLRPVPMGGVGMIAISRAGRAPNAPRTLGSWVPDPFAREQGQYLFLTGELGRIRASGELERLGSGEEATSPIARDEGKASAAVGPPAVADPRPGSGPRDLEAELDQLSSEVLDELEPAAAGDRQWAGVDFICLSESGKQPGDGAGSLTVGTEVRRVPA